jgi:hypothetical protein
VRSACHKTSWIVVNQQRRCREPTAAAKPRPSSGEMQVCEMLRTQPCGGAAPVGTREALLGQKQHPSSSNKTRHATDATPEIRGAPGPIGDARGARKAKNRHSATGGGAAASAERARWEDTVYRALDAGCTPQPSLGTASERPEGPEAHVLVRWIVLMSCVFGPK